MAIETIQNRQLEITTKLVLLKPVNGFYLTLVMFMPIIKPLTGDGSAKKDPIQNVNC